MADGAYSKLFFARDGLLADKWAQYLPVYDREIAPFLAAGRPVRLLEIGIAGGGSLAIWEALLPLGSRIVGMDIEPACATLQFGPTVEVHILDGTDPHALDTALGDAIFDIIIDDGSHRSADVVASFNALFRRLAPRGVYIVEDLHAAYWPAWGGRYRDPGSSVEFLKTLVDALHSDHFVSWDDAVPAEERKLLAARGAEITRVAFHDSIAVIERGPNTRTAAYPRIFSGGGQGEDMADRSAGTASGQTTLGPIAGQRSTFDGGQGGPVEAPVRAVHRGALRHIASLWRGAGRGGSTEG